MTADHDKEELNIPYEVVGAAIDVHNVIGPRHPKQVYLKALAVALDDRGLSHVFDAVEKIIFGEVKVGELEIECLIEDEWVIEVMMHPGPLTIDQKSQALTYMRGTRLRKGILLNFGAYRLEFVRVPRGIDSRQREES